MSKQVFFIPHGGGPLPLLGEENHTEITELLKSLNATLDASSAILLITAHWESEVVTFSGSASPDLIFDYHGFPPETYHYQYPVPGAPDLAEKAHSLLTQGGLPCAIDPVRGFDHGTFVPMMLMRPEADIPILQMSVVASFDPITHITAGQLLAPLLDEGVTIIGSGMTFHNMDALSVASHDWHTGQLLPARGSVNRVKITLCRYLLQVAPGFKRACNAKICFEKR